MNPFEQLLEIENERRYASTTEYWDERRKTKKVERFIDILYAVRSFLVTIAFIVLATLLVAKFL